MTTIQHCCRKAKRWKREAEGTQGYKSRWKIGRNKQIMTSASICYPLWGGDNFNRPLLVRSNNLLLPHHCGDICCRVTGRWRRYQPHRHRVRRHADLQAYKLTYGRRHTLLPRSCQSELYLAHINPRWSGLNLITGMCLWVDVCGFYYRNPQCSLTASGFE